MRHISGLGASRRYVFLSVVVLVFSFMLGRSARGQAPGGSAAQSEQRVASPALSAAWNEGVKALAEKIVDAAKPSETVSLDVQNLSSLGAGDAEMIREALRAELQKHGIRIASSGTDVKVTLSENANQNVWVAQIQRSGKQESAPQVAIISVSRAHPSAFAQTPTPILQRKLVDERREPVLDFASSSSEDKHARTKLVFGPGFLDMQSYTFDSAGDDKMELPPFSLVPRDLRGLVVQKEGALSLFAANDMCVVTGTKHTCARNPNQNWPFPYGIAGHFSGDRNYFSGLVNTAQRRSIERAFYTAAVADLADITKPNGLHPFILTELDGRARFYDQGEDSRATFFDWGDDIASITRSCYPRWFVLVTGTGDWTQADRIQTYEILFGQGTSNAKAEGQPLEFPGPILAMWPSDDEMSVRTVSKNLKTGMYEASIITLTCSQ